MDAKPEVSQAEAGIPGLLPGLPHEYHRLKYFICPSLLFPGALAEKQTGSGAQDIGITARNFMYCTIMPVPVAVP